MDEIGKDRIYILNSYAEEPSYQYQETVLGVSWDHRVNESWSWRIGGRYIWKAVDPPDKNETHGVFDLKWYKELGDDWLLTDRNRLDLRRFEGEDTSSFRYRNRVQIERPFEVFSKTFTGFTSYEIYYDSRYMISGASDIGLLAVSRCPSTSGFPLTCSTATMSKPNRKWNPVRPWASRLGFIFRNYS